MDNLVEQFFDFDKYAAHQQNSNEGMISYEYDHSGLSSNGSGSGSGSGSRPNPDAHLPSSSSDAKVLEPEQGDPSDPMLKYISLVEEEDLINQPYMLLDSSALQAAEKSFYEAHYGGRSVESPNEGSSMNPNQNAVHQPSHVEYPSQPNVQADDLLSSTNSFLKATRERDVSLMNLLQASIRVPLENGFVPQGSNFSSSNHTFGERVTEKVGRNHSPTGSSTKKTHYREENFVSVEEESRCIKQLASSSDVDSVPQEMYDNVLLCPKLNPHIQPEFFCSSEKAALKDEAKNKASPTTEGRPRSSRGRPRGSKKQGVKKEVVDLRGILVQCAQAVASFDIRTTTELLTRIRQHSSANGDGMERLAHYFAISLEGRLAGNGTSLYTDYWMRKISAADILKGYKMFVSAIPIKKVSNMFANKNIQKIAFNAKKIHIIDFGILYGFQYPCLIQCLSIREGGPPELRITGIDLPQPGLRPVQRVEETGQRLQKYCDRFKVPFKFVAIAKKWDTITLDDFKIDKDEVLVVNCMDRLANVPDETVVENCPRDQVLNLVKRLKPSLFIQSVINGTYNSPYFVTRFREALFHFSALFDMFDATVPRDNPQRIMFEQEILARDALNVIALEGSERVERPETYKQWLVRNHRAGFRQLPLDPDVVKHIQGKVKLHYHRDFSVDEDGKWMLQAWKGRVIQAITCWEPVEEIKDEQRPSKSRKSRGASFDCKSPSYLPK